MRRLFLLFMLLVLPAMAQDLRPSAYVGQQKKVTVRGGKVMGSTGGVTTIAQQDITPTVNATTYIYIDLSSTPIVATSTSAFPTSNYFPICVVITDINGIITSFTDSRPDAILGGGGISSNPSSAGMLDPTQAPYSVKADAYIFADGTSTNGSANFSSTSVNCAVADTGKLMIVVNPVTGAYPFGTTKITVTGCSGNSWVLSGTAGAAAGVNQNWAIGTDATPGGNTGLDFAFQTGITAPGTKGIALPCGNIIITAPPFQYPAVNNAFNSLKDIAGCGATGSSTTFIFHPQITSGLLVNGGNMFYSYSPTSFTTGSLNYLGLGGSAKISGLVLTSISGNLPGTAGKPFTVISQFGTVENVGMWGVSLTAGTLTAISHTQGEGKNDHLNLQQFGLGTGSSASYTGVLLQGQGISGISHSVIQGGSMRPAVSCNGGAYCSVSDLYCSACGSGISSTGTNTIIVVGSTIGITSSSSGAVLGDAGTTTWYVFGNPLLSTSIASFAPIQLGAGSILDMSGTQLSSATAGFNITGTTTSIVNDRAGNKFSSPLTQFTGTYIPIGGGSVANNSLTAATNFGANLGATNVLGGVSPANATYDVKIGFRQVTLGTTCGAGSNTVNGVLSWTAGGVVQTTGAGGIPALPTLTISANGAVGSSSAYSSVPVHIDINTQVTFTTTSVLASAGCTIVPQYVVDFSNI